jgi:hypothetical protein
MTAKDYTLVIGDKNLLPSLRPGWRKHCRVLFEEVGIRLRQKTARRRSWATPLRESAGAQDEARRGLGQPVHTGIYCRAASGASPVAAGRGGAGGGAQHLGGNEFRVRHAAQRHANGPALRLPRRRSAPALEADIRRIVAILNDTRARCGKGGFSCSGLHLRGRHVCIAGKALPHLLR